MNAFPVHSRVVAPPLVRLTVCAGLALLALASGCATRETARSPEVAIGRQVFLALPMPPGYPRETTVLQTVQGTHGAERRTFQSVVTLGANAARVIMTLPAGPRIMTINWSAQGVTTERTALAPAELKGENVLADIVITLWGKDAVGAALSQDATIREADGVRTIRSAGRDVLTVRYASGSTPSKRVLLTNHDFGYELVISSQGTEGG